MKFKSEHMTQASGSIAGVTYGRAKGGILYRRSRAIPVNPNTANQQQVRNALTHFVNQWTEVLTATQRETWNTYGQNVPVTDSLGSPITLSGQNWYIACNSPRMQAVDKLTATLAAVATAPNIYDRGDFTSPVLGEMYSNDNTGLTIDNTDDWANETGSAMLIFQGRPRNQSRNYFRGPFRLVMAIAGDFTTPPVNGQSILQTVTDAQGFPINEGQRINWVAVVTRADGRISSRRNFADAIAVAA